jgi:ABC-2 type transport system permease protein
MSIVEQGYQHWQGELSGHTWRWLTITRQGVRAQLRNRGTRIVVLLAFVPALGLAALAMLWGLFENKAPFLMPLVNLVQGLPDEFKNGPRQFRGTMWTLAVYGFFQIQLFFSMLLVLFVGPSLISQDLRFNAVPLYFSRPLRRLDYFVGKLGVIGTYLSAVSIVPLLVAYLLGLCFSLDVTVIRDTARLLLVSVLYGVVVVVSAGTLMLALSSLSRNSRYVGAMWLAVWIVGDLVALSLYNDGRGVRWGLLFSFTQNLKRLCGFLLDTDSAWTKLEDALRSDKGGPVFGSASPFPWYWSAGVLVALFGLSVWILTQRVKSLDRLK